MTSDKLTIAIASIVIIAIGGAWVAGYHVGEQNAQPEVETNQTPEHVQLVMDSNNGSVHYGMRKTDNVVVELEPYNNSTDTVEYHAYNASECTSYCNSAMYDS